MQNTITIEAQVILTPDSIDLVEAAEAFNEGRTVLLQKIEVEIDLDDIETDDLVNEVTSRIDITRTQAESIVHEMFDLYSDMEEELIEQADNDHWDDDEPENLLEELKREVLEKLGEAMSLEQLERMLNDHLKWQKRHREKEIRLRQSAATTVTFNTSFS